MKKDILKGLLRDFHQTSLPPSIKRDITVPIGSGKIISLIGARRSGKTFLLYQVAKELIQQGIAKEKIIFINFEDERLELDKSECDLLLQAHQELYPELDLAECHFFFDEIQNITGWEQFVRRLQEHISKNIYLTGSSARLLSTEIATALRGRALVRIVHPFSFHEFLRSRDLTVDLYGSKSRAVIETALDSYLEEGGFPETSFIKDTNIRRETLQEYYEVMLLRDLADRHNITNITALRYFFKRLAASATKQVAVHRIYNDLKSSGIRIGKNALYDFMREAEDIFLIQTLPKYSQKISTRELGEKKVYFIDNGMLNAIRYRFSDDRGKAMEQVVFWHLQRESIRTRSELSYYANGSECDFVAQQQDQTTLLQVCYSMEDAETRSREIKGLLTAGSALNLHSGIIVTRTEKAEMNLDGFEVRILPLAEFLLS